MIKISVIVPVYKVSLVFLRRCFDSLLAQTMQECEFIVVSDGAPEEERSICEEYAIIDCRFKFYQKMHAGVSVARNFGIDQAEGEYVAFLDSDDWLDSSALEEYYAQAFQSNCDILNFNYFETSNNNNILKKQTLKNLNSLVLLKQIISGEIFGGICSRIIRKDFIVKNSLVFPQNIGYCEDVIFWISSLLKSPKLQYLNKAFYHYNLDNDNSISRNYTIEKYIERKKYIAALKELLPRNYEKEINTAAFLVKMEAKAHGLLTAKEFMNFEPSKTSTILKGDIPFITKIYMLVQTIILSLFNKTYKEYI